MQRVLDPRVSGWAMILAWTVACAGGGVTRGRFGTTDCGEAVSVFTLKNAHGMALRVTDYGGIILTLLVPDKNGRLDDVVLGYDSLTGYLRSSPYFGALIGRYGNRITHGRFTLDGKTYTLATNNGPNHLHGGLRGFDKVVWDVAPFEHPDSVGLVLRYTSPNDEEGYPGTLRTTVTYTLTSANELVFDYSATTDRATPVNLTQHSYFNLEGDGKGDILGHVVTLNADRFTPVDSTLIPTGDLKSVAGTPFDFRTPTPIGAARVYEPASGRVMEIYTTEPGLQFYSGNFLDGTLHGKKAVVYRRRYGFAMETQHFPDSPNKPGFPSTILRPAEQYRSRTIYKFAVQP